MGGRGVGRAGVRTNVNIVAAIEGMGPMDHVDDGRTFTKEETDGVVARGTGVGGEGWQRGGSLPEDPRLVEFYPIGTSMHERLFFKVGDGVGDIVPFNERVRSPETLASLCLFSELARPSFMRIAVYGGGTVHRRTHDMIFAGSCFFSFFFFCVLSSKNASSAPCHEMFCYSAKKPRPPIPRHARSLCRC